jgi:hypothetical protein
MNLKKIGTVFTSKFVGTGPSSFKKRIYQEAVSQRLRNTAYIAYVVGIIICTYPLHTVTKIRPLWTPWWGEVPCIRERLLTTQLLNLLWVPLDWIPFL